MQSISLRIFLSRSCGFTNRKTLLRLDSELKIEQFLKPEEG